MKKIPTNLQPAVPRIFPVLAATLMLLLSVGARAQTPTFSPSSFTAQDQVTLTIDVTGTPMAGVSQAYIWIWANPSGVGPAPNGVVNGQWTASDPSAKMTSQGGNKWSFTFTGTTLFGLAPADLHDFGFLLKTVDGSKQTSDFKPFKFDPLVFTPTKLRIFPAKVDTSDVVMINFDQSLGATVDEQRMTPVSATVTAFDETGAQAGGPVTVSVSQNAGTTIWKGFFIPNISFKAAAGHVLYKFHYKFNGTVLDSSGNPSSVSTDEAEVVFISMK